MLEKFDVIVVTGGAGFIGSNLCRKLKSLGHRVISVDNYFTGTRSNHVDGVDYREGHTKNIEQLLPETPDLIYHLGEYSRVERSLLEPDLVWDFNKAGTNGVLEYCRTRDVRKLVYAGSSTKFADGGMGRDQSPYAWTKASNTELVRNYGKWYGLQFAITYFYNVYGPGERAGDYGTLIEIFHQQFKAGKPLTVVSPGTQRRCFTHIDDIIAGLLLVADRGEGDEFGLGSPESFSILEIAQLFGGAVQLLPERRGNRMDATLDTTKSQALGWCATRRLRDYIAELRSAAR